MSILIFILFTTSIGFSLGYFFGVSISVFITLCWIVPFFWFRHPLSLSLGLFDLTFATNDGGLHMDLGWILKIPLYIIFGLFHGRSKQKGIKKNEVVGIKKSAEKLMIHLIEQNIDEMYIKPVENEYKITMIKDEIKYFFMNMPKEAAIDLIDFFNDMTFVNNHDKDKRKKGNISVMIKGAKRQFKCITNSSEYGKVLILKNLSI